MGFRKSIYIRLSANDLLYIQSHETPALPCDPQACKVKLQI